MSLFSLEWFKSKKRIEPKNDEKIIISSNSTEYSVTVTSSKPFKSVKMVNDVITIVLPDGNIITKPSATKEDFDNITNAETRDDIMKLVTTPELLEQRRKQEIEAEELANLQKGLLTLQKLNDFLVIDNSLYIRGTNRSIPKLVAEAFLKAVGTVSKLPGDIETNLSNDVTYTSLKKFWLKCCLNPSAQSAEDLYTFLSNHQFKIDRHGNFYAYRRVVSVHKNFPKNDLVDFISNTYNKIKAVWKKKPSKFNVFTRLGEYKLIGEDNVPSEDNPFWEKVGNLEELYKALPDMTENRYTDQYTHKFDYRVGKSVSMPRHMGDDDNTVSCSKGFHAASKKYDYSGFGNTPILMIINPIDVLAVPLNEVGKLRVCRWFFAMTLPDNEKYILDDSDFDVTDLGDAFEEECMTDLTQYVQVSFAEEVQRHTFEIPQISAIEINNVVDILSEMREAISKRVINIVN